VLVDCDCAVHRYQELSTSVTHHVSTEPYDEAYDEPDYEDPDQRTPTYADIPIDSHPEKHSFSGRQLRVPGPNLPPRRPSVSDNISESSSNGRGGGGGGGRGGGEPASSGYCSHLLVLKIHDYLVVLNSIA